MRPLALTFGIVLIILGGYHPFNLWTIVIGLGFTIFGIFSKKEKKK